MSNLPFLNSKKIASVMIARRKPEGSIEMVTDEDDIKESHPALLMAAEDLIAAVQTKDARKVAEALKAAHEICLAECDLEDMDANDL